MHTSILEGFLFLPSFYVSSLWEKGSYITSDWFWSSTCVSPEARHSWCCDKAPRISIVVISCVDFVFM